MTTWENLLDGYSIPQRTLGDSAEVVTEVMASDALPNLYLDALDNLGSIVQFVWVAFASSAFLLVVFLGFWYLILAPFIRKLGIW